MYVLQDHKGMLFMPVSSFYECSSTSTPTVKKSSIPILLVPQVCLRLLVTFFCASTLIIQAKFIPLCSMVLHVAWELEILHGDDMINIWEDKLDSIVLNSILKKRVPSDHIVRKRKFLLLLFITLFLHDMNFCAVWIYRYREHQARLLCCEGYDHAECSQGV